MYIYTKTGRTSTPTVCVPLPSTFEDSVDVKYLYRRPRTSTKTCTTTVAVYHYFRRRPVNNYFHYRRENNYYPYDT